MTATARLACLLAYRGQQDEVGALTSSADSGLGGWSAWNSHWFTHARGALALTLGDPEEAVGVLTPIRGIRFAGRGAGTTSSPASSILWRHMSRSGTPPPLPRPPQTSPRASTVLSTPSATTDAAAVAGHGC